MQYAIDIPEVPRPDAWNRFDKPIPDCSGVYFAWVQSGQAWECVYVGESRRLANRLMHRPELAGTKITYLIVGGDLRKRYESIFIGILNPRMNCQSTANGNPCKGADEYLELVFRATVSRAMRSPNMKAMDKTVARLCHLRTRVVREAWKKLQKENVLRIDGDFAWLRSCRRQAQKPALTTV